ncbi:HAD-IA family hydrolase [Streptococcus marmotae]|uniref:HAD-IA family hydrolase n=1 Tax=Streptococcus marmotae TaxID=1825069 RepID=UPI002FFC0512
MCLASASKNGPLILEKLGLSNVFDAVVNPEEIAAGKPKPDIFIAAARKLHLAPEDCVGIEDSVAGVSAINAAGSISIGIGGAELSHAHQRFENSSDITYATIKKIWEAHQSQH